MRKILLLVAISIVAMERLSGQNIFNPNDPIVNYDSANPPATPPAGTIAKWVRTPRMSWNTSKFKSYYYNGIAFRLRFPTNYDPNNTSKKYPVIFFMHGGGEIAPVTDNEFHLLLGAQQFERMMNNGQFDAFMIFPQATYIGWENWQFMAMNNIMDTLQKYNNADPDRVITMGLSIGAHGTLWYSNLYPTRSATAIPSSPPFVRNFSYDEGFLHIPMWVGSGSMDSNPDPASVSFFVNMLTSKGASVKSSQYNIGHNSWEIQWKEPDLQKYWNSAHKANPIVFFNKTQIHPDSPINSKIGISRGFYEYEWQRDGITVASSINGSNVINDPSSVVSNTGNEITVKAYGVYSVRFRRKAGGPWSDWSPMPAVITANPIARAFDVNINLPYAEILDGRASTAVAGSRITKYKWTKVSGPSSYYLLTPDSPSTWINSVSKGVYKFQLTVTDEKGRTGSTIMTLTVNDGTVNQAPVANAGTNQTITLPANSVTLNGSGSTAGPGLSLTNYTWSQVSGPGTAAIASPNAANTTVNSLLQGVYTFRLSVTDNTGASSTADVTVTVNGATTSLPVAKAGPNQSITLPVNSVSLDGSGSTPPTGGSISAYAWTKVSGPASSTIQSPNSAVTTVNNLTEGTYVFRLTVTDNKAATASADVMVVVNALGSGVPVANAGNDETIPVGQATVLHGEKSTPPPGGSIVSYAWTKVSGPAKYEMLTPSEATSWIRNMEVGTFVFRLTIKDNSGKTATDDVVIIVQGPQGTTTVARAGANQAITLPSNVTLDGSGSSAAAGATLSSFNWSKVSGPNGYAMQSPGAAITTVTGLMEGTYIFRLTVTDNLGGSSTSDVTISVFGAGTAVPVANAGADETLPVGQATVLHGEKSSSPNGTITTYAWSKVSGPATFEMLTPNASSTWIRNMVAGTYVFRLTVTDNTGKIATDEVNIIVRNSLTEPTTARAGSDQGITLPVNSVTLNGSGSTAASGAVINQYQWSKVSGPAGSIINSPLAVTTTVSDLVAGVYVFRLTITDDKGAVSTSDVTVTVYAAGSAVPVANAGKDERIPVGQATVLNGGSSNSPNGSITTYAWTKFSGPTQFEMLSPNASSTWIRNMVAGTYVFRLTVTDNAGKIATDDVVITVFAPASVTLNERNLQMVPGGELNVQRFAMYPNPVSDVLNILWTSSYKGNAVISIYDFAGRRVKTVNIKKEQADFYDQIFVNDLKKGVYILDIRVVGDKKGIQRSFQK